MCIYIYIWMVCIYVYIYIYMVTGCYPQTLGFPWFSCTCSDPAAYPPKSGRTGREQHHLKGRLASEGYVCLISLVKICMYNLYSLSL